MIGPISKTCKDKHPIKCYMRSLKVKLIYSFAIVFIVTALSSLAALYSISKVEDKMELAELLDVLTQEILLVRQKEKNFLLYGNVQELHEAHNILVKLEKQITELDEVSTEYFKKTPREIETYKALLTEITSGKSQNQGKNLKLALRTQGHQLMSEIIDTTKKLKDHLDAQVLRYKEISFLLLWIAIPIGLLLCLFLAEWILEPIEYVRKKAVKVMSGEIKAIPVEPVAKKCLECDGLVRSINKMLDTIESKQQQLVQSEKLAAIGKVTAGIAHEINNPLNNINLTAEVLLEDMENMTPEERSEFIKDILVQTERAREIVHNLLQFSRMKKAKVKERVDVADLIENTFALLKNELKITHTKVKSSYEKGMAFVLGNPNQLQQVLVNIILNAIQAMGEGGKLAVNLNVDKKKKKVLVTIEDNGPGIPQNVLGHILEPFYTTKKDGTGLGLSVSYGIIKDHKGDIRIDSREGKGTKVIVELPLAEKADNQD
ncbi:MAG: hypothetical protein DSZ23_06115 [Thermodesulfatator sp.]|nr:MAG: hypothetical protein DSZ23_06115 [Thermodesulfatator sp.]